MKQRHSRRIVLAVTAGISLSLMTGLPERLARDGWDVHVVADGGDRLTALGDLPDVSVHALRMSREPDPVRDLGALFAWIRLLRDLRPDVVLAGTPKAGLLGMVSAWVTRVRVRVYHVRGLRLETTAGLRRRIFTVLERISFRCATTALCVSRSLAERIEELDLARDRDLVVLGRGSSNGVDVDRFTPGSAPDVPGIDDGVPVVGFVGRLNHDKGIDVLAEAGRLLDAQSIDHQLLIVGGVDGTDAGAFARARRPPIVTGHVADTAPYYRVMRLLSLPTLREGFPNVVLEASASGTAVVTTDATGAIDSVEDGVTGLITRAGDAQSLAGAMRVLLEDPARADQLGTAGREFVRSEFAREHVQDSIAQHLEMLHLEAVGRG